MRREARKAAREARVQSRKIAAVRRHEIEARDGLEALREVRFDRRMRRALESDRVWMHLLDE